MRLSDAGLRQRQKIAVYPNHRSPPWLTEDATRDRSNRLLGIKAGQSERYQRIQALECPDALAGSKVRFELAHVG
jgi:hypothetical protein